MPARPGCPRRDSYQCPATGARPEERSNLLARRCTGANCSLRSRHGSGVPEPRRLPLHGGASLVRGGESEALELAGRTPPESADPRRRMSSPLARAAGIIGCTSRSTSTEGGGASHSSPVRSQSSPGCRSGPTRSSRAIGTRSVPPRAARRRGGHRCPGRGRLRRGREHEVHDEGRGIAAPARDPHRADPDPPLRRSRG